MPWTALDSIEALVDMSYPVHHQTYKTLWLLDQPNTAREMAEAGVTLDIDPQPLFDTINNRIDQAVESIRWLDSGYRGAWVKATVEDVNAAYHGKYNVMVFNMKQDYTFDPPPGSVHAFKRFEVEGDTFGVWVFDKGTFINHGDGGYINWAFRGAFERDDKIINFQDPTPTPELVHTHAAPEQDHSGYGAATTDGYQPPADLANGTLDDLTLGDQLGDLPQMDASEQGSYIF